jgi:hypothetical protein
MSFSVIPWRSLRSAPAQNALFPRAVTTIARTDGFDTASRVSFPNARSRARERLFIRASRSIVQITTPPRCSTSIGKDSSAMAPG